MHASSTSVSARGATWRFQTAFLALQDARCDPEIALLRLRDVTRDLKNALLRFPDATFELKDDFSRIRA
jgi:hypothetical protein